MNKRDRTFIIAEAGVNHNGSLDLAKQLIETAASSGADAVKFQTFRAENLVCMDAPKASYQARNIKESQYEMLKSLELSFDEIKLLNEYSQSLNIKFLSTPFDEGSLDFLLNDINLSLIKIASGEITNAPLLLKSARSGNPIILSTGMSLLGEIETALSVIAFGYSNPNDREISLDKCFKCYCSEKGQKVLQEKVSLLHCTTEYPAPFDEVNLNALATLKQAFNLPVGYSDHTRGIAISLGAVALGATIIEKHFTLDRTLPGPDHQASLEPQELAQMIAGIREIERAMGNTVKLPTMSELENKNIARKSLVALQDMKKGEAFTAKNLGYKRPGSGISPIKYWEQLKKQANKNYIKNDLIEE